MRQAYTPGLNRQMMKDLGTQEKAWIIGMREERDGEAGWEQGGVCRRGGRRGGGEGEGRVTRHEDLKQLLQDLEDTEYGGYESNRGRGRGRGRQRSRHPPGGGDGRGMIPDGTDADDDTREGGSLRNGDWWGVADEGEGGGGGEREGGSGAGGWERQGRRDGRERGEGGAGRLEGGGRGGGDCGG
eukprot:jgi/Undpi1/8509/HiC_scaffold_25.g10976.m1